MSFRATWRDMPPHAGVEKDAVASFVKTLYYAGLTAAREQALRDGQQDLIRVLAIGNPDNLTRAGETRRVARRAAVLLRILQQGGAP